MSKLAGIEYGLLYDAEGVLQQQAGVDGAHPLVLAEGSRLIARLQKDYPDEYTSETEVFHALLRAVCAYLRAPR